MSIPRILCVDDDPMVVSAFQRVLRREYQFDACASGDEALQLLETAEPYPVILADMTMPGMSGAELLGIVSRKYPDMVRIMLTGNADQRTAAEAVNRGQVFRFLSKPCPTDQLSAAIQAALHQHGLATAERQLLESTLRGAVATLVDILSAVDPVSFGLGQTLRDEVREFFEFRGLPVSWECEVAALLSQIGYVTVPQAVVKRFRLGHGLTGAEKDMIARVPQVGADLLSPIPRLESVAQIVRYQRKNLDGSGFPHDTTSGPEIPYGARLLRILLALHDLNVRGPARGGALMTLRGGSGHFDEAILEDLIRMLRTGLPKVGAADLTGMRKVRELEPGLVLLSDIMTLDGMLIVPTGQTLSAMVVEKVQNFHRMGGVVEPIAVLQPAPKEEAEVTTGAAVAGAAPVPRTAAGPAHPNGRSPALAAGARSGFSP